MNRCGKLYLSKGITKRSEVADTKGSTVTMSVNPGEQDDAQMGNIMVTVVRSIPIN